MRIIPVTDINYFNNKPTFKNFRVQSFEEFMGVSAEEFVKNGHKIAKSYSKIFKENIQPQAISNDAIKTYEEFQKENCEFFMKAIPKNCKQIVDKFMSLPSYGNEILLFLIGKKKSELEHLYELAIKEDSAGEMRIPGASFHYFSQMPEERLKMLEPIILSVNEIGKWNYSPNFMWYLDGKYSDYQLGLMSKMAQLKINGWNLRELVRRPNLNHSKIIEKAKIINQIYTDKLKEIQFLSNSKKQNYISAEIKEPNEDQISKTVNAYIDNNENPITNFSEDIEIKKCAKEIKKYIDKSLNVFSPEDLDTAINQVKKAVQEADEIEILRTMQKLTQFASYSSIPKIEEMFENENIVKIYGQQGLNGIFSYFSRIKNILNMNYYIKNKFEGIVITKDDLNDEQFVKFIEERVQFSDEKFIILEGWSDGINLFNDDKLLAQKTIDVIKKAKQKEAQEKDFTFNDALKYVLNNDIETCLKEKGALYSIITDDVPATRQVILDQTKPIMPTETMLESTIKSLTNYFSKNKEQNEEIGRKIAAYYRDNLNIYSKQRMIEDLKILREKIEEYLSSQNISKEDVYILTPKSIKFPAKSFNIVNKMLADIMQIPKERQVQVHSVEELSKYPENSAFIISDDIVASGESMSQAAKYINDSYTLGKRRIIFCPITGAKEGIRYLENLIRMSSDRKSKDVVIYIDDNFMSYGCTTDSFVDGDEKIYSKIFGESGCANLGMCTVFPYMAPDNNSDLAAYFIKFFTPTTHCIKNKSENLSKISEDALYFDVYGKDKKHVEENGLIAKIRNVIQSILPLG